MMFVWVISFRYNKLSTGAAATKSVLSDAGSRTAAAAKNAGSATAKKLGEIRYKKQLNHVLCAL